MPVARIGKYHGEPSILIDGVPYPPMTITVATPGATTLTSKRRPFSAIPDYLRRLGEAVFTERSRVRDAYAGFDCGELW